MQPGDWIVVDDGVMGGRSRGNVGLSEEGHGIFQGTVSQENNGGFSSIRVRMEELETKDYSAFKIRLKGDGKNYQFRGMRLNMPSYPGDVLRECSFLISNKKNESFRLEIDRIWLETGS